MSVLLHPTLASKPVLADAVAKRLGGEWEMRRGYCRLRSRASVSALRPVRDWLPNIFATLNPSDPSGPRAA